MGAVSGAHLNPAVTLAFAVRRNFPWNRVPGYVLGQAVGGVMAALFLRAMFGTIGALGATVPGSGIGNGKALAMEVLSTAGLGNTILSTASGARNIGTNGAIAVGRYIALAGLWAAPISGASMNPARSFAPDLVHGNFSTILPEWRPTRKRHQWLHGYRFAVVRRTDFRSGRIAFPSLGLSSEFGPVVWGREN